MGVYVNVASSSRFCIIQAHWEHHVRRRRRLYRTAIHHCICRIFQLVALETHNEVTPICQGLDEIVVERETITQVQKSR